MRPYIIINGTDSRTIGGLLIQTLPPITKPRQRTEITQIEGRDGDVVEVLGYEAYDKTLKIGLYGDYDVDETINYLQQGGAITFSNEPDKVYYYEMYEQIDFTKLLRFKEAEIVLHVQPFKYSNNLAPISQAGETTRAVLNITNAGNYYSRPIISITGYGLIYININGVRVMSLSLGSDETTATVKDYNTTDADGNNLNRQTKGDFDNIKFKTGENELIIEGYITNVTVDRFARWL